LDVDGFVGGHVKLSNGSYFINPEFEEPMPKRCVACAVCILVVAIFFIVQSFTLKICWYVCDKSAHPDATPEAKEELLIEFVGFMFGICCLCFAGCNLRACFAAMVRN
jgi:hypothetical protein